MSLNVGMLLLVVWGALGCGDKLYNDVSSAPGVDAGEGPVTYAVHIKPILDSNCTSCHASSLTGGDRNGAPADFNFDNYSVSKAGAVEANEQIQPGFMPPGGLPKEEKGLFQQWLNDGLLESDCQCEATGLLGQHQAVAVDGGVEE